MKALVGPFNQEKALVGAFSVMVKTGCGTDGAIHNTWVTSAVSRLGPDQVDGYQPPGEEVASLAPPQHTVTFMCPEMDRS